ncbi:MAG: PEP-CTERM sorting domain-containing protein [Planctomycetes bacterium]|nr:PEP-CTERM sorting domain-containing protein [Planctomycetota bacterium]
MKKLVVLTLVLSMASLATAGLEISINGVQGLSGYHPTTGSGTIATLGVYSADGFGAFTAENIALIAVDDTMATIHGTGYTSPVGFNLVGQVEDFASVTTPAGSTGVFGGFFSAAAQGAGQVLYDDIIFDFTAMAAGGGDTTIELWAITDTGGDNWVLSSLLDSIYVMVPEPTMMALLGLGGLLLRRRK